MKIALCLSGHSRTHKKTFPYWKKYLMDQHDVDVFAHMWDSVGTKIFPTRDTVDYKFSGIDTSVEINVNDVIRLWNPVRLTYEPYTSTIHQKFINDINPLIVAIKELNFPNGDLFTPMPTRSMMYKRYACNEMKNQYEKYTGTQYDIVFQTRFDTAPVRPVTEDIFSARKCLYTNHFCNDREGRVSINDYATAGSPEVINLWCSFYEFFTEAINSPIESRDHLWNLLNHHTLYKQFLDKHNCPVSNNQLGTVLIRNNGSIEGRGPDVECLKSTLIDVEA